MVLFLPRFHPTTDSGGLLHSIFLFPFYIILFLHSVYTFTQRALSEGKNIAWSMSRHGFFPSLMPGKFVCALSSSHLPFFSGIQFSLVNAHVSVCDSRHGWFITDFFLQWYYVLPATPQVNFTFISERYCIHTIKV